MQHFTDHESWEYFTYLSYYYNKEDWKIVLQYRVENEQKLSGVQAARFWKKPQSQGQFAVRRTVDPQRVCVFLQIKYWNVWCT